MQCNVTSSISDKATEPAACIYNPYSYIMLTLV